LIAEQLPFTRNRLDAAPLTSRIASGAICRAALYGAGAETDHFRSGSGCIWALASCIAERYVRARINRNISDLAIDLLEDAFALGGGAIHCGTQGNSAHVSTINAQTTSNSAVNTA
jgi:uncharacterized membrane protein